MSKKYNTNRISKRKIYTVKEIAVLLGVHTRTVQIWLSQGLRAAEHCFPYLIHGEELAQFLAERQKERKCKLAVDEYFCVKCQQARKGLAHTLNTVITDKSMGKGKTFIIQKAQCEVCGRHMNRFGAQPTTAVVELLGTGVSLTNLNIKQTKV